MLMLATAAAAAIAVVNGRKAVDIEMRASIEFFEHYMRAVVQRITAEGRSGKLEELLAQEIAPLRHAKIYVLRDNGEPHLIEPSTTPMPDDDDNRAAPQWFISIMMPADARFMRRHIFAVDARATLLIVGHAEDEINEKWHELSALALLWLTVVSLLLVGLHAATGRILNPLVALAGGLTALEAGQRDQRLVVPRVRELADISHQFNSLAMSLDQTRDENGALYRQMMDVQEEERRLIANELHDEAGPCLFGITANTESIVRLTNDLPAAKADQIRSRTTEVLSVTERLKSMNRSLLRRLRPSSIGKVSLTGLMTELIRDFERRHPEVHFIIAMEIHTQSYGDAIDLTVYRCVQEALTNAIRHGRATSCIVNFEERAIVSAEHTSGNQLEIQLTIRDNGHGLKPGTEIGFGLAAMRERVLSVGGAWTVGRNWPSGTMVTVKISPNVAGTRKIDVIQPEMVAS